MSAPLEIDLRELHSAFEDASPKVERFLDLRTGGVVERPVLAGGREGRAEGFDPDPERYAPIPRPHPRDLRRTMRVFAETVPDPRFRDLLCAALKERGSKRRFMEVLASHRGERGRWILGRNGQIRLRVLNWLGIRWLERRPAGAGGVRV